MPIILAPTGFVESPTDVKFQLALKSKTPAILVTSCFLRVSQGNFLSEIDFLGEIDDTSVIVTKNEPEGLLSFQGKKRTLGIWGSLALAGKASPDVLKRRERALALQTERDAAQRIAASENKHAAEKRALAHQMGIESDSRALIETKQKDEREKAEVRHLRSNVYEATLYVLLVLIRSTPLCPAPLQREVYDALRDLRAPEQTPPPSTVPNPDGSASATPVTPLSPAARELSKPSSLSKPASRSHPSAVASNATPHSTAPEITAARVLPPPRGQQSLHTTVSVPVVFTPRVFPTPARESKAAEEADWLTKNAAYIKGGGSAAGATVRGMGR